jgi:hypothetical protein
MQKRLTDVNALLELRSRGCLMMTDADFAAIAGLEQLEALIQRRLKGRVQELRLSLRDRGLVLRGSVDSFYLKQLVQHAAMKVSDLPIFANEIEVL